MHAPVKRQIITYNRVIMEAPSRNESDAFKDMSALPQNNTGNYGFKGNPVNNTQKLHLGISILEKKNKTVDADLDEKRK